MPERMIPISANGFLWKVASVFLASSSQRDSRTWSTHFACHHLIHLLPLLTHKEGGGGVIFNSLSVLLFWLYSCPTHTWLLHTPFLDIKVCRLAGAYACLKTSQKMLCFFAFVYFSREQYKCWGIKWMTNLWANMPGSGALSLLIIICCH